MSIAGFTPNQTADVYRSGNAPPANPDVAGVQLFLEERWENVKPSKFTLTWNQSSGSFTLATALLYSHVAHVAIGADLRDTDTIYVPDKNGTPFTVQFVARRGKGTSVDHKVAYLLRADGSQVPWPTDNV
jgi:hypothetical protein